MINKINPELANKIFDILVEECGASETGWQGRDYFVDYVTGGESNRFEFRFMGDLQFGGKIHINSFQFRVGCYSEDLTIERENKIIRANKKLEDLYKEYDGKF